MNSGLCLMLISYFSFIQTLYPLIYHLLSLFHSPLLLLSQNFQIFAYELFIFIALIIFMNFELIYVIFHDHYESFGTYRKYLA